jgi:hypothetical protein
MERMHYSNNFNSCSLIAICFQPLVPFYKFLKQHLNLKHLLSRDINGIKVMIHLTLILAILLIVYKKHTIISSYKIAKFSF